MDVDEVVGGPLLVEVLLENVCDQDHLEYREEVNSEVVNLLREFDLIV